MKGGHYNYITHCRRQCIEVRSADESAQSVENFFSLHFSVIRMGSRGTFVLCTASSRCTRIAGPGAAMCFFLLKFRSRTSYVRTRTQQKGGGGGGGGG